MATIHSRNGETFQVSDEHVAFVNQWKWSITPYGMVRRSQYKPLRQTSGTIYLHREIAKLCGLDLETKGVRIGFLDHDCTNCTITNLIAETRSQNSSRQMKHRGKLRAKGVTKRVSLRRRYQAQITVDGKTEHLGYFETEREAAREYNEAAREYFGEHAYQNNLSKLEASAYR